MKYPFYSEILNFLFPPLCHICHSYISDADAIQICPKCRETFTAIKSPYCTVCGIPFNCHGDNHICGVCTIEPPKFDSACAAYTYHGGIKELLHNYKYTPKPQLRKPLGLLLVDKLTEYVHQIHPDLILPVPLHKKRLRQRGFNQAILLGEILSKQWHLPLERNLLQRIRYTKPQVTLSAVERRTNVNGAFAVKNSVPLSGKKIVLLDDVFTTGSTLNECAKALKSAGAIEVHCITVARAI